MFRSLNFLKLISTKESVFYLIDSEFECEIVLDAAATCIAAPCIILEYRKRNYSHSEIIKRLFRCNLYLCNKFNTKFEYILEMQYRYSDRFKKVKFKKKYYQDLKDMWDKHKVFI